MTEGTQHPSLAHHTSITFMICGRVIGNELRDVPPECVSHCRTRSHWSVNINFKLPIWGQRWSGYRAPHGPSPFSTRVFSVDRMSEMGPALTSPTQFEAMLTEEDEGEDTSSESGRLYSTFPSSPSAIHLDVTELTPRSVHCSSSHPHGGSEILHRSNGHPPPQNSTCFGTTLLRRQRSEQSYMQRHALEPLLHPPALHHGISIQGGCGSFENDYSLWDMDPTSAGIQPPIGSSYRSHVPSGQLQHALPPPSIPEFANAHTQSSAYLSPLSLPGRGCLFQPFQADDRAKFITTTPPPPSYCLTLSQQNGIDSSWNHDSSMTMIPSITHTRNPMISQWPSGSVPPNLSFPEPLQNSGSSLGPGVSYHPVSNHRRNLPHPEDLLGTFAHAEGCTLLSLDNPGSDQFTR